MRSGGGSVDANQEYKCKVVRRTQQQRTTVASLNTTAPEKLADERRNPCSTRSKLFLACELLPEGSVSPSHGCKSLDPSQSVPQPLLHRTDEADLTT